MRRSVLFAGGGGLLTSAIVLVERRRRWILSVPAIPAPSTEHDELPVVPASSPKGGSGGLDPADIQTIEGRPSEGGRGLGKGVPGMSQTAAAAAPIPRHRLVYVVIAGLAAASAVAGVVRVVSEDGRTGLPSLADAQRELSARGAAIKPTHHARLAHWKAPAVPEQRPVGALPPRFATTSAASSNSGNQPAGGTTRGGETGTGGGTTGGTSSGSDDGGLARSGGDGDGFTGGGGTTGGEPVDR